VRPLLDRLFEPRDIRPLAFLRIAFGLILLADFAGHIATGEVRSAYITPPFHFKYYGFEWVEPWGASGMYLHFYLVAAVALSVALGLFYRVSAILLFLGVTYVFLLDQAEYLNHYYLVCILCFLFIFLPAHRAVSLDALRRPEIRSETVPAWTLLLLRAQLAIVYIYAGIAKLNPDWLRGEPMRSWLAGRRGVPVIGPLLETEWAAYFFSYGGILLDLFIVPLLVLRRTRLLGFALAIFFHLTNAAVFEIGIFPWLMIAATLLLFSSDDVPGSVAQGVPAPPSPRGRRLVLGFLGAFLAIQLLVPLRHLLYPGDVAWTEEGHRFSWRMKLRGKTGTTRFTVSDPVSGKRWDVLPTKHLTERQVRKMAGHPDMVLQFAHHLADVYRKQGYPGIQVRARVHASLNGRRPQLLVDPDVDLAAERRTLLPAPWIVPLREPLRR
jgi:vitamin K-dependent gamma-carboxylase